MIRREVSSTRNTTPRLYRLKTITTPSNLDRIGRFMINAPLVEWVGYWRGDRLEIAIAIAPDEKLESSVASAFAIQNLKWVVPNTCPVTFSE